MAAGSKLLVLFGDDPDLPFHRTGGAFFCRFDDTGAKGMVTSYMKFFSEITVAGLPLIPLSSMNAVHARQALPLRQGMKDSNVRRMKLFSLAIAALAIGSSLIVSAPVKAVEYKGICYFNDMSMQCTVRQNPFTMTMIWADGVVEVYSHQFSDQGDGFFVDKRGGIWRPDPTDERFMVHKNGNRIGFYEY